MRNNLPELWSLDNSAAKTIFRHSHTTNFLSLFASFPKL